MRNKKLFAFCAIVMLSAIGLLLFDGYRSVNHGETASQDELHGHSHDDDHNHGSDKEPHHNALSYASLVTSDAPIQPILPYEEGDEDVIRLGWVLFRDTNLSSNNKVSCQSCHDLNTNGAEPLSVSIGVNGVGKRNSLTVFNVAHNYRFFWDGRVNTLQDQIDGPVHDPVEMDSSWQKIVDYVTASNQYLALFARADLTPSEETIKHAMVEFMKSLTTMNAPFDQYLMGDSDAINESAVRGWQTFQSLGCIACHRGTNVGGGLVMQFGYFGVDSRGAERSNDLGRFNVTSKQEDKHLFRVASLRNVAITSPYFHDGMTGSLDEAIKIMARSQLGKELEPDTVADIKAFLESLTGERPTILEELQNEQN
ncbi:cytochrome-c peroxidase [Vibrio hippocampi]|uniref:Cytochrome c domain-containing protein n=1 Tax=Vibrio hippocampi TaxID=654686 RepID=A0ABN8DG53_9VIBR|nr:cytochrome c peroxidase [Vibrio hippocampi]CAH0526079.1 hypothetical protein VHP8226_01566 [Vibrio hippocampi]